MTVSLKIDFVSDVACPWCAVGLGSLREALGRLEGQVKAELHFQPFELNPDMSPEGQDLGEHLARKYGSTPEQQQAAWQALRERAAAVGFEFRAQGRGRIWNTFDAHRLLHWAGLRGAAAQTALKVALLRAYFGRGENPSDPQVLLAAVAEAGLELDPAREILAGDAYADAVREREHFYTSHGIQAVPSVIVNDRHLIQGGQPPEVFEQALRQIAAQAAQPA
ncbi:MAG: DsbA family oxidoreductase [Pseudomonadota bacterium]